jgi:hypothetical protein
MISTKMMIWYEFASFEIYKNIIVTIIHNHVVTNIHNH